eukprot:GHVU01152209.1.p1 GENE.GHVU01152209.1~~GHVU01152209.1.p1  ORF type:complete len:213 (+),score=29.54 GHVU01152209.1:2558-3196(+)
MKNKEKQKEYQKQYRLDNKERIKEYKKQWRLDNKEKQKEYQKQYRLDNKERILEESKQYYLDNKERVLEYAEQYRLDNKERIKEYKKQYRLDNKEKRKQYRNERYNSDPLYKFKLNCRSRTYKAFKQKSWKKNGGTEKLLGCDYQTAMNHIESQFVDDKKWMNWDNHGEWEIDHIIPLASANTKEEMNLLFNYKNLQPLLAEDNMRKGDRIL